MTCMLFAAALLAAAAAADETDEAGRIFKARCAACHTVPDRGIAGDRAWLGQIPRTA
jgi:mono/diheme cytochrome c family protein